MDQQNFWMHLKLSWPILTAASGFVIALLIAMRYKLPDLTRRMEMVEKKGANSQDLDRAIDNFRTVCSFNQVSCQKEMEYRWAAIAKEHENKLGELYEKLNTMMVENGKLFAKVEILIQDREREAKNGNNH